MPDRPDEQSRRLAALDALQKEGKGVRTDPSALRLYIRDNYPSLVAARGRGVSWQQIADVMAGAGVRAPDGSALTWRKVATLFHTERYGRNPKRRRATARKPVAPGPSAAPEPGPPSPPAVVASSRPPTAPVPAGHNPSNPWAEVDRQTAEAKRRREQVEAAKDWNPYATKEKPE